jgi:hypothetical protein
LFISFALSSIKFGRRALRQLFLGKKLKFAAYSMSSDVEAGVIVRDLIFFSPGAGLHWIRPDDPACANPHAARDRPEPASSFNLARSRNFAPRHRPAKFLWSTRW